MPDYEKRRNPLHDFLDEQNEAEFMPRSKEEAYAAQIPGASVNEEYGAEVAPAPITTNRPTRQYEEREEVSVGRGAIVGYIALALSILAFFTYPVLFGGAAVLLGLYARNRGASRTATFAIVLGVIAAVMALFFRIALATFLIAGL